MLTHIVLFWLNDAAPDTQRDAMLADCDALLKKIPSVRQLHAGRAVASSRPIVDSSYDVGLCVVFDNQAGHDAYQEHSLHQQFLARHKQHWTRIQVYDFA